MKAQHRKELQTNVLADSLGRFLKSFKSGSNNNLYTVVLVGLLAVGLYLAYNHFRRTSTDKEATAWMALDGATTETDLKKVADQNGDTIQGRLARLGRVRMLQRQGEGKLFSEGHKKALEDLEEARGLYDKLAGELRDTPVLAQEALLGSAKANECLGKFDQAREKYQALVKDYPDSVAAKKVQEALGKDEAEQERLWQERVEFHKKIQEIAEASKKRNPPIPSTLWDGIDPLFRDQKDRDPIGPELPPITNPK